MGGKNILNFNAIFQQMRCKSMTQRVHRDVFIDTGYSKPSGWLGRKLRQ